MCITFTVYLVPTYSMQYVWIALVTIILLLLLLLTNITDFNDKVESFSLLRLR